MELLLLAFGFCFCFGIFGVGNLEGKRIAKEALIESLH
jgi:hypothetical protein